MSGNNATTLIIDEVIDRFLGTPSHNNSIEDTIDKVYFNEPYTIVIWKDYKRVEDKKTIVKCSKGCKYDKFTGLALCILKRELGQTGFNHFKKYATKMLENEQ